MVFYGILALLYAIFGTLQQSGRMLLIAFAFSLLWVYFRKNKRPT